MLHAAAPPGNGQPAMGEVETPGQGGENGIVSEKVKTNFGAINGQRIMTFAKTHPGDRVVPVSIRRVPDCDDFCTYWDMWITPLEAFRRWKIARKAWRSRKRRQLEFGL